MTDQSDTLIPIASPGDLLRDDDHTPLVVVPVETLGELLGAWTELTAHYGRDAVPVEGDNAYDTLAALVAEALS